ncbi:MAG: HAD family hydrolase [Candidatus Aenigmarchaeota archaeon]|nr:HAD family hydrolase [Candidatus Aenigmarchaeota archaeon]
MPIRAVFFDLGNTLVASECFSDIEKDVEYPFWVKRGYDGSFEDFKKFKSQSKEGVFQKAFRDEKDKYMWTEIMAEFALGKKPDDKTISECYELVKGYYVKNSKLREGTIDTLKYLKSNGIKIVLISNNWEDIANEAMDSLKIREYFDDIIISDVVKAVKSEIVPFKIALERTGISPEDCLMVGDDLEDSFCKKLNMKFALLDARNNKLDVEHDYIIKSIRDIRRIIEAGEKCKSI